MRTTPVTGKTRIRRRTAGPATPARSLPLSLPLVLAACAPATLTLSRDRVPAVVDEYATTQYTVIPDGSRSVPVDSQSDPQLLVCYSESDVFDSLGFGPSRLCASEPLGSARVVRDVLRLRDRDIPLGRIQSAELRFDGEDPRERAKPMPGQPGNRWGVNLTVGGPAPLAAIAFDARIAHWLGVEVGGLGGGGGGNAYLGFRLVPARFSDLSPYVGAYGNAVMAGDADDDSSSLTMCAGARVGLAHAVKRDVELRVEGNFARCEAETAEGESEQHWLPWAGGAMAWYW